MQCNVTRNACATHCLFDGDYSKKILHPDFLIDKKQAPLKFDFQKGISGVESFLPPAKPMASGDNIIAIRDERGRYRKDMPGGPGRPVGSRNRLSENFLTDLQADWEQHGKDILSTIREKHPELYFQCMVKLALVHPVELYPAGGSNRRQTPEEIMAELEERVGPEGRKMFERFMRRVQRLREQQLTMSPEAYEAKGHRRTPSPKPQSAERTGPERLHWRAKQTERATKHTYRWTPAHRSATKRATANPYGITLDRVWTDWAAQHGVSETIAAALHLVSRDRKAQDVVVKLTPGEVERVVDIVQRWPDHFPPGTLAALEESRPTPPEPSAASRSPGVGSARPATLRAYGRFTEGFDTLDLKEAKALLDELAT
jgi:hypothetical protein